MNKTRDILQDLQLMNSLSPMGFAMALHIRFSKPSYLFQSYSEDWMSYYSENGLVMNDPTVHWGFENEGTIKWSELDDADNSPVLKKAAEFGLRYGLSWAHTSNESLSLCSFACNNREFDDEESAILSKAARRMHDLTSNLEPLSADDIEKIRDEGFTFAQSIN